MPKRTDLSSILIIGSGPIIIGQGAEFDYSGTQAVRALKEEGYRVILVNSNPATIMTDPEFADRTYIEPVTPDWVTRVIENRAQCRDGARARWDLGALRCRADRGGCSGDPSRGGPRSFCPRDGETRARRS
jgi:hypothetical protein